MVRVTGGSAAAADKDERTRTKAAMDWRQLSIMLLTYSLQIREHTPGGKAPFFLHVLRDPRLNLEVPRSNGNCKNKYGDSGFARMTAHWIDDSALY
jgi:hypothetical protein